MKPFFIWGKKRILSIVNNIITSLLLLNIFHFQDGLWNFPREFGKLCIILKNLMAIAIISLAILPVHINSLLFAKFTALISSYGKESDHLIKKRQKILLSVLKLPQVSLIKCTLVLLLQDRENNRLCCFAFSVAFILT